MECRTPGFPVHHQLPVLTQTHVPPGAYSNSCPSSWWCHPTISSSVVPFSSCPQSFPASGSFPMSQFITSGSQSIGVSASASVLPMNIQYWFPLGLTGWISLQSKGLSRIFSNTIVQKHQYFGAQLSLWSNCQLQAWGHKESDTAWWLNNNNTVMRKDWNKDMSYMGLPLRELTALWPIK